MSTREKSILWRIAAYALIGTLAAFIASVSHAQEWAATRTTTYDYTCQDAAGTVISGHTRLDAAFVACSNLTLKDGVQRYVIGGRYRIARTKACAAATCPTCPTCPTPTPPATGTATLRWTPPTQNTDGTPLTNLAGYRILYGASQSALTQTINVTNAALTAYAVENLSHGTWYFAVRAVNAQGVESASSNIASKVIPQ